ncbi:hypothetical protein [Maricaulis sp.]|uniref:hypothetical protein n=1 Tax=Maricaulis sp. TaxID=1486257 RepID=UPI001B2E7461|nr:hypothetical protein [Maricaulis sp.]MBO6797506.1 hypothetical protein [Maricaulis sp.]
MIRSVLLSVSALALMACTPQTAEEAEPTPEPVAEPAAEPVETAAAEPEAESEEAAEPAPAEDVDFCALDITTSWEPDGVEPLIQRGTTRCAQQGEILITRTIYDAGGHELYRADYVTDHIMTLSFDSGFVTEPAELPAAIEDWLTAGPGRSRTSELPPYQDTAEFPFMSGADGPNQHEAWRSGDYPMQCYVQGMESMNCVALVEGEIVELGYQLFPG